MVLNSPIHQSSNVLDCKHLRRQYTSIHIRRSSLNLTSVLALISKHERRSILRATAVLGVAVLGLSACSDDNPTQAFRHSDAVQIDVAEINSRTAIARIDKLEARVHDLEQEVKNLRQENEKSVTRARQ